LTNLSTGVSTSFKATSQKLGALISKSLFSSDLNLVLEKAQEF
jgi:hypothetical protein